MNAQLINSVGMLNLKTLLALKTPNSNMKVAKLAWNFTLKINTKFSDGMLTIICLNFRT